MLMLSDKSPFISIFYIMVHVTKKFLQTSNDVLDLAIKPRRLFEVRSGLFLSSCDITALLNDDDVYIYIHI